MDTGVTGANFRDADLASARIGRLVGEGASNLDAALNLKVPSGNSAGLQSAARRLPIRPLEGS